MKFSVLKMAIAAVCLHGSITVTPDTSSDYLEDQGNYVQIAGGLTQGWHWGLSSANACGTTGDLTNCFETYYSGYGDYDDGGYYDDGYGYDTGGGSGGSGSNNGPGEIDAIEACEILADAAEGTCIIVAAAVFAVNTVGCTAIALAISGGTAGTLTPLGI